MLTPDDVTAVLVTRGDVDLAPVLESLIFPEVIVWDNSVEENEMTFGRIRGSLRASNSVIYSQDDDLIHTADSQRAILEAYEPGVLTGCMWQEWNDGAHRQGIPNGYDDLVFPGSGSISDRTVLLDAADEYVLAFQADDFFRLWCDTIVGVIAPTKQIDVRFEALPCAEDDNRMTNLPGAVALKSEAIKRARWVRSGAYSRAIA